MPGAGVTGRGRKKPKRKTTAPFSARARRQQSARQRREKFFREDQGIEGIDFQ
jgi:hypothetical protein